MSGPETTDELCEDEGCPHHGTPHVCNPIRVAALVDAAWQVLDDMGNSGTSCCLAAKAQLRIAIERFAHPKDDDDLLLEWPLSEAAKIMEGIR